MLIDHHCHLDFPDFAEERDAVVARAKVAGVTGMVTISTRIRRFPEVLAVAQAYDNVYCSVGTHPHYAHEELDVDSGTAINLGRVLLREHGDAHDGDPIPARPDRSYVMSGFRWLG